jgi:myo-inositol-1(or 4)-monophosphatase
MMGVVAGRVEAYHEQALNIWDAAAGLVLVRAAGGQVMHADWRTHLARPSEVLVWNGRNSAVRELLLAEITALRHCTTSDLLQDFSNRLTEK